MNIPNIPCKEKSCSLSCNGICIETEQTTLTAEKLTEMLKLIIPGPLPVFYASNVIDPDECFKADAKTIDLYSLNFDKNVKEVYICGKNVRDALIKKGVVFQNYKPEKEK